MALPSDFSPGITSAGAEQFRRMGLSHLFQFDLSALKQTGQAFPERQDVSGIHHVLDVACGSGEWAIGVARANPHMQVVGIDNNAQLIEEAQKKAQGVTNISFRYADPFDPRDLTDSAFDVVNARFLVGLLPLEAWPTFVQTCLRLTRRGGIVRLTEGDIPISNSPALERMNELLSRALWPAYHIFPTGENLVITPLLRRLLRQADCQDIQKAAYVTNFSTGMQAHDAVMHDLAATYRQAQSLLVLGGTSPEEVEQQYQRMLAEMQADNFCGVAFYLTVWGKKAG